MIVSMYISIYVLLYHCIYSIRSYRDMQLETKSTSWPYVAKEVLKCSLEAAHFYGL
jgi:hypothetical protein